jgi:hypothetical protein
MIPGALRGWVLTPTPSSTGGPMCTLPDGAPDRI